MIAEQSIKDSTFEIMGEAMEWGFENEKSQRDAMNYLFGVYDLAQNLLRRIKEEEKNVCRHE